MTATGRILTSDGSRSRLRRSASWNLERIRDLLGRTCCRRRRTLVGVVVLACFGVTSCSRTEHREAATPVKLDRVWQVTGDLYPTAAISSDGRLIAISDSTDGIRLLDAGSGKVVRTLKDTGRTLALSPTGDMLAVGLRGVRVWDVRAGRVRTRVAGRGFVRSVAFALDGRLLATAGEKTRLWEVPSGRQTAQLPRNDPFMGALVASSPDGLLLAYSDAYHSWLGRTTLALRLWDVREGRQMSVIHGVSGLCAFSSDGRIIAAPAGYDLAAMYDTRSGKRVRGFEWRGEGYPIIAALSPDGSLIAVGGSARGRENTVRHGQRASGAVGGVIKIWDARTGSLLYDKVVDDIAAVMWLQFTPDGRRLIAVTSGWQISVTSWRIQRVPAK